MPRRKIVDPSEHPLLPRARPEPGPAPDKKPRYTVVRDTREKEGQGWEFPGTVACAGTVREALPTGDYTLKGFESVFTIDRKGAVSEFATNVFEERFERELARMATFELAVVLLEFELSDIVNYPRTSGIPKCRWKRLRVNGSSYLRRFWELQLKYPHVHFLFAGRHGKEAASSLFKRFFRP